MKFAFGTSTISTTKLQMLMRQIDINTHEKADPNELLAENQQTDYDSNSSDDNIPLATLV